MTKEIIDKDNPHKDIGKQKFRVRMAYTAYVDYDVVADSKDEAVSAVIEKGGIETVAESEGLIKFMDGYVPSDAEAMTVSGADGRTRAWKMGGRVILRTPLTLLSPSWDSSIASGDGRRVYSLKDTPVVLLSERGQMVQAHLSMGALADE